MNAMEHGTVNRNGKIEIERIDPRLLTGDPTYLFNIYSCEFNQNTGSTGAYYIPPCPEGQEWVRSPQSIPGTVVDTYPHFQEGETYRAKPVIGDDIVKAVLGIAPGQNKSEDIRRFGVFASKTSRPSKEDLAEAKRQLVPELQRIVREADEWSVSADTVVRMSIDQHHYDAARRLNVTRPWMSVAEATGVCVFCGSAQKEGVPRCGQCGEITNQVLYDAIKARVAAGKTA